MNSDDRGAALHELGHEVDVVGFGLEFAALDSLDEVGYAVAGGGCHADLASAAGDVSVEVLDLGAPALDHVLEHGGATVAQLSRALGKLGLEVFERGGVLGGIHVLLGRDVVDGLHRHAQSAAHSHDLGPYLDGNVHDARRVARPRRAQPGQRADRVGHRVGGELGPAVSPQVGRDLRGADGTEHVGNGVGAPGLDSTRLSYGERQSRRYARPDRVGRFVHASAQRYHAAQHLAPARNWAYALVIDAILR